jgi:hypothetical protein
MYHTGATDVYRTEIDFFVIGFGWKDSAVILIFIIVLQCHYYALTTLTPIGPGVA